MFCSFTFANNTRTPWPTSPRRPYPPNSSDLKAPSFVRSSWMPSRLWRCGFSANPHMFETFWNEIPSVKSELWDFWWLLLAVFLFKLLKLPWWPFHYGNRRKPCRWWTSRERPSTLWIRSMSWNLMGRAAMSPCWSRMDMPCRSWGLHRTLMR